MQANRCLPIARLRRGGVDTHPYDQRESGNDCTSDRHHTAVLPRTTTTHSAHQLGCGTFLGLPRRRNLVEGPTESQVEVVRRHGHPLRG
jgi:hypothetical protein